MSDAPAHGQEIDEAWKRVTGLTEAECRDALAYLTGFTPLGVNLAISTVKARQLDKQTEPGG